MKRWFPFVLMIMMYSVSVQAEEWLQPIIGSGYGVQVKEGRTNDAELDMIARAGLTYVRFVIPWDRVETKEGKYDWSLFDSFIERLRQRKLKAVIVLGGGHPAYTEEIDAPKDNLDHAHRILTAPASDRAIDGFARFAAQTLAHYGGSDIVWELWNEPDSDRFWPPKADVSAYINLAGRACAAMRKVLPQAHIVGPGMADFPGYRSPFVPSFLGPILNSPLATCLDAVSLHAYRNGDGPPETVLDSYRRFDRFVSLHGPVGKKAPKVLSTEWGFTLTDVSPDQQAAFVLRSYLLNTLAGVPLSIWYEWRDARAGDDDPEAHFGLLTLDRQEKPAYKALADFLPPLKGAVIEKRINVGFSNQFVLVLRKPNRDYALVFWSADEKDGTKLLLRNGADNNELTLEMGPMPKHIDIGCKEPLLTVVKRRGQS